MSVILSRRAELPYKALEDVWVAERIYLGAPNLAAWHCHQAAEKMLKGTLRCYNKDYDYGHSLNRLMAAVIEVGEISEQTRKDIIFIDRYNVSLRYKNLTNDPSPEEVKAVIHKINSIIKELSQFPELTKFFREAEEVHSKVLRQADAELTGMEPELE